MTSPTQPEFSRLVALARLGAEPFRQEITATEAERAALARRFDLPAVDQLCAVVELVRHGKDMFRLRATLAAEFVQSCVVTLDPVDGAVSEQFTVLYGPPETEEDAGGTIEDDVAFEPIAGNAIDVGEAVAQQFSLALPPFPRSPGASLECRGAADGRRPLCRHAVAARRATAMSSRARLPGRPAPLRFIAVAAASEIWLSTQGSAIPENESIMAVPKKKTSPSRRNMRRSHHALLRLRC